MHANAGQSACQRSEPASLVPLGRVQWRRYKWRLLNFSANNRPADVSVRQGQTLVRSHFSVPSHQLLSGVLKLKRQRCYFAPHVSTAQSFEPFSLTALKTCAFATRQTVPASATRSHRLFTVLLSFALPTPLFLPGLIYCVVMPPLPPEVSACVGHPANGTCFN